MDRLPRYDGFAIDLDGVVWLSREPIDGSAQAIRRLREAGRPLVFVTNDPRSTREELATRLGEIGAPTDPADLLTSATTVAETLARERPGATVISLGTGSLAEELSRRGLRALPARDGIEHDETEVVVIGGGGNFDFEQLRVSAAAVRAGAELWATNTDPTYPGTDGLEPGTGAIVAAIEVASGKRARNIGKPEPAIFEAALRRLGTEPARTLMAGDNLRSDIGGGAGAGLATALILSGHDGHGEARGEIERTSPAPDHVFASLAELAAALFT